ncbi:oligosaccharide flippase family protein [Metabacillus herbersteinensis]|uniref:Oligosaccharide flippase family protein n=1 Tax=Metabacillus herbersteinensis TaxID=283816 RepID=A0ABV6GEY5_9BACI
MLKQLKRLGGDSLLYALMNVGTKLIAFLMLPIYTTYLNPSEMGAFELIESIVSILTFVIIFGTDNALAYYFYKEKEEKDKEQFFKTALSFRLVIAMVFFLIFIVMGPYFAEVFLGSRDYYSVVLIAGTVLISEAVITLLLTFDRFNFKSKKVAGLTVFKLLLVALSSYVLLKFLNLKVESIYIGRLISGLVVLVFLIRPLFNFLSFKFRKDQLIKLLRYGAPLVPASIAFWIITFSNRIFLSMFESLESVGIFGVAIKFATVITLLTSSVQMAWRPYSMSIKDQPNAKKIYANIFYIILIIGMLGLISIASLAPFLLKFMVPDMIYMEAANYIAMLSLGSFLSFYYLIVSVGLFLEEKTAVISIYVGISAVVSVILNISLIPLFSIWGAVLALVISYVLVNVLIFIKSQSVYYIPVSLKKLLIPFIGGVISTGSIVIIYMYNFNSYYIFISWIFFFIVLLLTGFGKTVLNFTRGR